jgi:hypothetical protein
MVNAFFGLIARTAGERGWLHELGSWRGRREPQ